MAKNSVVAGEYKGYPIGCGSKGPFINLNGPNSILLNTKNVVRYEEVKGDPESYSDDSLAVQVLGRQLLSSMCALLGTPGSSNEFILVVEFATGARSAINLNGQYYRAFVNSMLSSVPGGSHTTVKKKGNGLLTFGITILSLIIIFGAMYVIGSRSNSSTADLPDESQDIMTSEEWLAFDDRSWSDFLKIYEAHNNLVNGIDACASGSVSMLDLYQQCQNLDQFFGSMVLSLNYGENDDQDDYLSALSAMASRDQQAVKSLMKYLDSGKMSDLSDAQNHIQDAVEAATVVATNRGTLLANTDLTDEEILQKIEESTSALQ